MLVDATTGAVTELLSAGKAEAPCMASLSKTELLVIKDSTGLILGPDGKPKPQVSSSPEQHAMLQHFGDSAVVAS